VNFRREIDRINWIPEERPIPPLEGLNPVQRFEIGDPPIGTAFVFGRVAPEDLLHYQEFARRLRSFRGMRSTQAPETHPAAPPRSEG